jgi:transcriptional regulator with XRE-family HTH domain
MTDLGNYLSARRKELDLSLRDIAEDTHLSHSTYSNFESGRSLPAQKDLKVIARVYQSSYDLIKQLHGSSLGQTVGGSVEADAFIEALSSTSNGDHLIVVTQSSLVSEQPSLATKVLNILQNGAYLTYIYYAPLSFSRFTDWDHNHVNAARILDKSARRESPACHELLSEKIGFLALSQPTPDDFAHLRAFDATLYLCRSEQHTFQSSQAWSENRAPDNNLWWQPLHEGFITSLHDWISSRCGLQIPHNTHDASSIGDADARGISYMHLDTLLDAASGRTE